MILIIFVLSYLIGSFPSAFVLSKAIAHKDILSLGDKNVGARNVFHTVGKKVGLLTFLLDFLKGTLIWLLGSHFHLPFPLLFLTLFFGWLGHCFPIWLRFKGGKGVALIIGFLAPQHIVSALLSAFLFIFIKKWVKDFDLSYTLTVVVFLVILALQGTSFLLIMMISIVFLLPLTKDLLTKQKRE